MRLSQTVLVQAENTYLHTIVSRVSFCLCYPKYPSDFRTEESFKIQTKYWINNNYKKCGLQNTASTYNWIIGFYIGFYMIYIIYLVGWSCIIVLELLRSCLVSLFSVDKLTGNWGLTPNRDYIFFICNCHPKTKRSVVVWLK